MTPNPTRLSTGQPSTLGSYRDNCIKMGLIAELLRNDSE